MLAPCSPKRIIFSLPFLQALNLVASRQVYIEQGYAQRVPDSELQRDDGRVNYVPHHDVPHGRKALRIVFDTSLTTNGKSLNSITYTGPDVLNSLTGVVTRFRQEDIAVTSDLKSFYHCVKIPEEDTDMYRFFWYSDNRLGSPIVQFKLVVHLFGGRSSQSCSSIARDTSIDDAEEKKIITPENAAVTKKSFYSDDYLNSFQSVQRALQMVIDRKSVV